MGVRDENFQPQPSKRRELMNNPVYLVASGDLRLSANLECWPVQAELERRVRAVFEGAGVYVRRAHPFDENEGHGFISSQRMGMNVFCTIPNDAPVIVAEAVWQYSHHVLAGLRHHTGPILTVANWSGQWPGLVGLLNLNGSLTKAGVPYSTLWSENFTDEFFLSGVEQWIREGKVTHDTTHVHDLEPTKVPSEARALGESLALRLKESMAILGVFDEGCMGMYNAIIDDELLNPMGIYKERLSQSALVAAMRDVNDAEAQEGYSWLIEQGMTFEYGKDPATELTEAQVLEQLKMYIAAVRIAHSFGCDAIGIQYQQGLKDMVPASDLVEGLLNNVERPPVFHAGTGEELYSGKAIPHFNEVDEGSAVDALVTNRIWNELGFDPATTLHDLRWGENYKGNGVDDFVWVFEISGAVPASHFEGGYKDATGYRQPPMFFPRGGSTLSGVSKPGELVWSRVFVMVGELHADIGRASAVDLPERETGRRREGTNREWPIMHAVLHGVSRNQMMARHKANHIQVAYAPSAKKADEALLIKATMLNAMGLKVHLCGRVES